MDISGSYTLHAPRERVWAALLNPALLRQTIPGCEQLEATGENTYALKLSVGVAAIKGTYSGTLRLSDIVPPEHYTMSVEGNGARGNMRGTGTLQLGEAEDGTATLVNYSGHAQLGGPIASVGSRVAGGVASMLIKLYFGKLDGILKAQAVPPSVVPTPRAQETSPSSSSSSST